MLQLRDFVHHVALEHSRVVPFGILERRGHDVLGQAVQPVRQLATPGRPPRCEPLVAPPTEQQGLGAQGLVEREFGDLLAACEQTDPASACEALVTGRVFDDSVKRDVLAHDDLSHFGFLSLALSATTVGGREAQLFSWWCRPVRDKRSADYVEVETNVSDLGTLAPILRPRWIRANATRASKCPWWRPVATSRKSARRGRHLSLSAIRPRAARCP